MVTTLNLESLLMLDSPSSLSYSVILSIMQVLISVILQMQYSAHGWLLEIFLVFQLVQAGIGTSMCFIMCSLLCLRKHDYGLIVDVLFKIVIIHLI